MILTFLAFLYNLFLFLYGNGHPVLIITSGIMIALWFVILIFKWMGKLELATYLTVPYMLGHTVATVCVYKGWLVGALQRPNKDIFDFQILLNFILINAIPLIEIRWTIFGMLPCLLIGTYLQVNV